MRLRVLVLTNLFPTPWDPLRGAFNRQQFERLAQHHDVDVLTAVDFRERMAGVKGQVSVDGVRTDHFTFVYPPRIGRSLHAACWALSLWLQRGRRLRAAGYDCLLASWAYPDAAAAGWLARRLGIPYVVKVHGSDLNVQAEHALRRLQIRSALRGAAAVVTVSRALAEKAVALDAPRSMVHVLYNGVDPALFSPGSRSQARAHLHLPPDTPLVLYVGNLKESKGCLDLLEAFPALMAAQPAARLVYVGAGPCWGPLLERATALGFAERVHLVGAIPHDALGDWFRAADLLCLPSHNEGVPNVVLEAMACGTPVVATRVGGIPEVLPDVAGLLTPAHDRQALSGALVEASSCHWDREAIARQASAFRWDDNVSRLADILRDAAATAPAAARATA
ncbi:glycosyltransferase family 4 protein [Dyella solisilvae]|uniref:Glycosyltransferase family 4 protein n=1 Tax=Dyella solisilvae TaxID=1920168 RepID=A0A370K4W3_9GAMM|nr:glycosyltransferase family 4 protein [Dyella solisilvae]RDI97050.1 glycosyltransferase family 4 protein [Dyella solisilvae]